MKTIDFLPERYKQATKRRRTSYWRLIVTGLFVLAFASAAGGLFFIERDVRSRWEHVNSLHAAAQAQQMLVASKQLELAELRHRADLATFLRHPWPRSRIVHEALAGLPQEVSVERIKIHSAERPKAKSGEVVSSSGSETTKKAATAETDLNDLRSTAEAIDVLVTLEGITLDQPALHVYLQTLAASRLFVKAELTSIEAATGDNTGGEAKFAVRIVVRPGWGMPGGPSLDEKLTPDASQPSDEIAGSPAAQTLEPVEVAERSSP